LVVGCARFTYDETPTPARYEASPPLFSPVATGTPQQGQIQDDQDERALPIGTDQGSPILRTEPSVINFVVGETQLVQVWIDDLPDPEHLHSIELHIGFEPTHVRIEDADPEVEGVQIGVGVVPMPGQVIQNEVDNDAGVLIYHVTQAPGSPATGGGMVASFTVRALAEGGSPLKFSVVNLRDAEGRPLSVPELIDGLVIVGDGGIVLEPTAAHVDPTPVPTTGTYHTVQPGENLFRIALRYGTSVEAVVAANNLSDPSAVQVGQELLIPAASSVDSTSTYVVQPGDTLYSIARRFGTSVDALATLNGIAPPYTIGVGQTLRVTP
jgi:LysM repeat protein